MWSLNLKSKVFKKFFNGVNNFLKKLWEFFSRALVNLAENVVISKFFIWVKMRINFIQEFNKIFFNCLTKTFFFSLF